MIQRPSINGSLFSRRLPAGRALILGWRSDDISFLCGFQGFDYAKFL